MIYYTQLENKSTNYRVRRKDKAMKKFIPADLEQCKIYSGFSYSFNQKLANGEIRTFDIFFVSDRVNITKALAKEIAEALDYPVVDEVINYLMFRLNRAECNRKFIGKTEWINIQGEDFGGEGQMLTDYEENCHYHYAYKEVG